MMRGASVVIAPHGAGLSNCVFMPPGSRVVELTSGLWWHPCFRNLAHLAGLDHHLLQLPYRADRPHGDAADAIELLRAAGLDRSQM
jgi:capsular polysaccharide biosynthesis protein